MSDEQQGAATPGVHQITVGLSGFPDVSNQYGTGVLRSDSVDLFYFPNGVVAARLYGTRIPEDGAEPDGRLRNNYQASSKDDTSDWPDWLAAQVREHEPTRLSDVERSMLRFAMDLAQDRIFYSGPGEFTDEDQAAVNSLKRLAGEEVVER